MKIVSFNANGIRSAGRKGFFDWFDTVDADILCIQETKAQVHQLSDKIYHPDGYLTYFVDAKKPGYSGVAIYSRLEPQRVITELGWPLADSEGRYCQCDFKNFSVASLYLPSGSSGEVRQQIKYELMDYFAGFLAELKKSPKPIIICGDWNIVHKEIDIKNWRSNQKNSGCLPKERAWLDKVFTEWEYLDAFRLINQEPEQYTWWSNRANAYANNVGWRIDYQVISASLKTSVDVVEIYKDQKFSDHAPLIINYNL